MKNHLPSGCQKAKVFVKLDFIDKSAKTKVKQMMAKKAVKASIE